MATDPRLSLTHLTAEWLAARAYKRSSKQQSRTWVQRAVHSLLIIGGYGFLTYSAFRFNVLAGLVAAGLSCFALAWHVSPDTVPATVPDSVR